MIEKLTGQEITALDSGECPDCGSAHFLESPHGGLSVNIMCADCGAKFNITPGIAGSFGKQRIGRPTMSPTPKWLPHHLFEIAGRVHIIVGPNGKCMCGIYNGIAMTCLQILASVSPEMNSAMIAQDLKDQLSQPTPQPQ